MNGGNMKLSNFKIKGVSSIVRDRQLNSKILNGTSGLDVVPDKFSKRGDLVLVRVAAENSGYCSLENINGRSESLYQGDYFIGVLGNRYSCQNYYGHWDAAPLSSAKISLLTNGGIIGICDDAPLYKGMQIELEPIGVLADKESAINIFTQYETVNIIPIEKPLIFVCATSGETGKTTVTKNIIKEIKKINPLLKIAGVKLSGTGCMEDILEMKDAGADAVADLCDVGVVSSYDDYEIIRIGILRLLSLKKFESMDAFICEFGGDFTGGNVNNVLQDREIMKHVKRIVFNYYDVAGLIAAKTLFKNWGIDFNKVFIAHNIFRNITAINKRLVNWDIPFASYDVNHLSERIKLAKDIISEIQ